MMLKLQYFGHLMWTDDSLAKSLMLGKTEERWRGCQMMRWLDSVTNAMQWRWTWANSGTWWRTGRPGMLQSVGSQRGGDDWVTQQQQQHLHWSPAPAHPTHPQYLRMWLYLEIGSLKMQLVMMKSWGTLIQDDWCPYKKEKLGYRDIHTHRESYEHDGRDQGDPSVGQRTPKIASNHQNLGKRHGTVSQSQTLREPTLLILISDF